MNFYSHSIALSILNEVIFNSFGIVIIMLFIYICLALLFKYFYYNYFLRSTDEIQYNYAGSFILDSCLIFVGTILIWASLSSILEIFIGNELLDLMPFSYMLIGLFTATVCSIIIRMLWHKNKYLLVIFELASFMIFAAILYVIISVGFNNMRMM